MSVSKGLAAAAEEAASIGANTMQIFSSSPRMWRASQLDPAEVKAFAVARRRLDIAPLVIHDSYLINLASSDDAIWMKSAVALRGEIERAIALDADFLVAHPGAAKGLLPEDAIRRLAVGFREAARGLTSKRLTFLWEITAGQGSCLGCAVDELREIREQTAPLVEFEVGYCLDTAHAFAAGIDLMEAVQALGPDRIGVIHSNDSKAAWGSHVDRHDHIGKGYIGEEAFRRYLSHPDLSEKAFILETPEDDNGGHAQNIATLQRLCRKSRTVPTKSSRAG